MALLSTTYYCYHLIIKLLHLTKYLFVYFWRMKKYTNVQKQTYFKTKQKTIYYINIISNMEHPFAVILHQWITFVNFVGLVYPWSYYVHSFCNKTNKIFFSLKNHFYSFIYISTTSLNAIRFNISKAKKVWWWLWEKSKCKWVLTM